VDARYDALKRRASMAYVAWFFLGIFGTHRFYLKRVQSASVMLALAVGPYVAAFVVGFILGLLDLPRGDSSLTDAVTALCHMVLAGWMVVDAFLIPGMVEHYNLEIAQGLNG
jgi:TM2 domain-containing membrane protein YozV